MNNLPTLFPSLTLFSDLDWDSVTKEYEDQYIHLTFPEYLQEKAVDGDCPPYLFELAFYEQALFEAKNIKAPFPHQPGIYLNPTSLFLSLEFDIPLMIAQAKEGSPSIIEREHILAVYKDEKDQIHTIPLTSEELTLLQDLEEGPILDKKMRENSPIIFQDLVRKKLIFDLL